MNEFYYANILSVRKPLRNHCKRQTSLNLNVAWRCLTGKRKYIRSRAASYKRPILSVDVSVCVCLCVGNFDVKYLEN